MGSAFRWLWHAAYEKDRHIRQEMETLRESPAFVNADEATLVSAATTLSAAYDRFIAALPQPVRSQRRRRRKKPQNLLSHFGITPCPSGSRL